MTPFREDLWNLPEWMYALHWGMVIACGALVVYGLWRRVRLWRMGRAANRTDQMGKRFGGLLLYALGQRRILSQAGPGLMHGLIFYGFVAFFIATSLVGIQMDAGLPILQGDFYLCFELIVNAFTLLFLAGLGLAALRRYVRRPDRLNIKRDDAYVLGSLAFIALTGLSLEVMRLRSQQPAWAEWSWLGNALAGLFGPPPAEPPAIYPYVWWAHQLATFGLIATLPYTKFLHIVTSPTNIFLRRLDPPGALPKIEDIEDHRGTAGRRRHRAVHLEATAGRRRLHRVRPLPGCLPGLRGGPAPVAQAPGHGLSRPDEPVSGQAVEVAESPSSSGCPSCAHWPWAPASRRRTGTGGRA